LRSASSIGANVEEALGGYSKNDFRYKLSLSYKEARETKYWLRLMKATEMLDSNTLNELLNDCEEGLKILGAITRTLKIRNS
jgi:four helix bundle protein